MNISPPLISVITVVYNARFTIETTIRSVLEQDQKLYDYWIIDGGSTDGTLDIIRRYEDRLAGWVSEPDKGIYEAMNKGVRLSRGQWLYFLGADDQIKPNALSDIILHMDSKYAIIFGSVSFDTGHVMNSYLNSKTLFQNTVHHQSAFYNRQLFNKFNYNISLRTIADYELNLMVYTQKLPVLSVPIEVAFCQSTGASSEWKLTVQETNIVRRRYVKPHLQAVLSAFLHLYYAQKRVRRWIRSNLFK